VSTYDPDAPDTMVGMQRRTLGGWTHRDGRPGRYGVLVAAVWLVFLIQPFEAGWSARDTTSGRVGMAATLVFGATYVLGFRFVRRRSGHGTAGTPARLAVPLLLLLVVMGAVMCLALGESGMGSSVYIAVGSMMFLPTRVAAGVTVLIAVVAEVLATGIEGWESDFTLSFSICVAALATWGITQLMNRNVDLLLAREENARLAVEEERNRMARDLHDILGHSLTVITVKAELAGRLMDADPARARAEVADLERLSRDALVDVRRAVEGFHELTLPGELARAREALRSAGIEADLPGSAEDVPSDMREVFAWAVREGVTNVIRHSGATRCTVRLGPEQVEVLDNGSGAPEDVVRPGSRGHGLAGLRERATAVGATLLTRTVEPQGFSMAIVTERL
jgi:two-component system, NarL family, sensor histidine kinase DesK